MDKKESPKGEEAVAAIEEAPSSEDNHEKEAEKPESDQFDY